MLLSELFNSQPVIEITGLAMDSRKVEPGNIFFCLKGTETDGHRFAGMAAEKGAAVIVHSEPVEEREGVHYIKSDDVMGDLNRCCDLFNGQPSRKMTMFGVTGTNGKSTTASIIGSVYSAYKPCGYMGTIAVRYGDYSRVPTLTTPDQIEVHADLAEMYEHGMQAAAMEVSSHGLAMNRADSVDFDCVIFTNLTWDHLDFHKTMENYFEAKKRLFQIVKPEAVAVLNADDEVSIEGLKECCACRYVTYGTGKLGDADYMAKDLVLTTKGTEFTLVCPDGQFRVLTNLVAEYNIYNLLAAIAAMREMSMPIEQMLPLLKEIPQVDGRMEIIDEGQDFGCIVDYAHTPDGFDKVFKYADAITAGGGNVYAVFGSAGKRDKKKRPVLGQIAGKHCRKVFVTEEDPRTESAEEISQIILSGVQESGCEGEIILDRIEAIKAAVRTAKAGDLVLILGKGDETYMYYADGRVPFIGDNAAAREALKEVLK